MPQLAPKKHAAAATLRPLVLLDEVGLGEPLEAGVAQEMGNFTPYINQSLTVFFLKASWLDGVLNGLHCPLIEAQASGLCGNDGLTVNVWRYT